MNPSRARSGPSFPDDSRYSEERPKRERCPPGQGGDPPVDRHHALFAAGIGQRSRSAHDGRGPDAVRQESSTDGGVWPAARDTHHREMRQSQMVGQNFHVVAPVLQPPPPLKAAQPVTGPVRRDQTNTGRYNRPIIDGEIPAGSSRSVKGEHRLAVRNTEL